MARIVSLGAHTPLENVRRPFFSCTVHVGPAALTRRVSPASPGGNSSQPAGIGNIFPSSVRTVLSLGPGETTRDASVIEFHSGVNAGSGETRLHQSNPFRLNQGILTGIVESISPDLGFPPEFSARFVQFEPRALAATTVSTMETVTRLAPTAQSLGGARTRLGVPIRSRSRAPFHCARARRNATRFAGQNETRNQSAKKSPASKYWPPPVCLQWIAITLGPCFRSPFAASDRLK